MRECVIVNSSNFKGTYHKTMLIILHEKRAGEKWEENVGRERKEKTMACHDVCSLSSYSWRTIIFIFMADIIFHASCHIHVYNLYCIAHHRVHVHGSLLRHRLKYQL